MKKLIYIFLFSLSLTAAGQDNIVGFNAGPVLDKNMNIFYERIGSNGHFGLRPFAVFPVVHETTTTKKIAMGGGLDAKAYIGHYDGLTRFYIGASAALLKSKAYAKRLFIPALFITGISINTNEWLNIQLGGGAGLQYTINRLNHQNTQLFAWRVDLSIGIKF